MPSEIEIVIAFLFNRSGKSELKFSDLYLTLSMELNWFTPEGAKRFLNHSIKENLLTKKEDMIKPAFDYKKVTVPVGYSPSNRIFEEKVEIKPEKNDILQKIIERIVENTDIDKKKATEEIKIIANEKNISTEVAALLIGKEHNVSLKDFFEETENKIFE